MTTRTLFSSQDTVISELQAGNFDLLEEQYKKFSKGELQPNGDPKSAIFFGRSRAIGR